MDKLKEQVMGELGDIESAEEFKSLLYGGDEGTSGKYPFISRVLNNNLVNISLLGLDRFIQM